MNGWGEVIYLFKLNLQRVFREKDTMKSLVMKSLKNRYAGTFLGFGWSILNPILLALVISFVFTHIFRTDKPNFTSFVLSGMLPWFFFASSINESSMSILNGSNLLSQFSIPRDFFPIAVTLSNFIIFLTGLGILIPFFLLLNPELLKTILLLPVVLTLYFFFTVGFSLISASINVIFRDLSHILNIGLMLWMWVTPIFYSVEKIPPPYNKIMMLNPVVPFSYMFHGLLYDNNVLMWPYFLWVLAASSAFFTAGYLLFVKLENTVVKRM